MLFFSPTFEESVLSLPDGTSLNFQFLSQCIHDYTYYAKYWWWFFMFLIDLVQNRRWLSNSTCVSCQKLSLILKNRQKQPITSFRWQLFQKYSTLLLCTMEGHNKNCNHLKTIIYCAIRDGSAPIETLAIQFLAWDLKCRALN